ncbi:protein Flattop homolog [Magallana gigas]|uniref:Cilia- and flagella-associated protein 126 n=1 Tax=Magallana gigas TaxID=29159 RepID=K1QNJ1_MAGGI|eukprot:XP_011437457.1 PREDICTED: protein Flattop homolog [Crassostrea gigas]
MSLHFSANQYDQAFDPHRLQNWEVPKQFRPRPRAFDGFTQIVANNRGHLLSGVKRSRESPWGNFVGTWDMPLNIPGNKMMNSTARTFHAQVRLERCKTDGDIIIKGKLKRPHVPDPLPIKADREADKGLEGVPPKPLDPITSCPLDPITASNLAVNGSRSGAKNPEPITRASPKLAPLSPSYRPKTPSLGAKTPIDWPRPASRVKSASPKIGSPEPELQQLTAARSPVNWPSPKSVEPEKVAA